MMKFSWFCVCLWNSFLLNNLFALDCYGPLESLCILPICLYDHLGCHLSAFFAFPYLIFKVVLLGYWGGCHIFYGFGYDAQCFYHSYIETSPVVVFWAMPSYNSVCPSLHCIATVDSVGKREIFTWVAVSLFDCGCLFLKQNGYCQNCHTWWVVCWILAKVFLSIPFNWSTAVHCSLGTTGVDHIRKKT